MRPNCETGAGRASVLIADDDPEAREVLSHLIELMLPGVQTVLAADGQEAVDIALDVCPWAAILDLGMPRLDGFDAAQRLHQRMGAESPILIAVSGDYKRLHEGYGVFDYSLRKPFEVHRLARYLSRAIVFPEERTSHGPHGPSA
jgi:two-component system CheB/CheR fusion protein